METKYYWDYVKHDVGMERLAGAQLYIAIYYAVARRHYETGVPADVVVHNQEFARGMAEREREMRGVE